MKKLILLICLFTGFGIFAQTGGQAVWQFLDLDFNARSLALGGDYISNNEGDINLAISNPSSINEEMDNHLSLNHFIYPAGINYGSLAYGKTYENVGSFVGHLRYVSYGKFARTDQTGVESGTFTAGDYSAGLGYGKKLNKYFSIGGNFNMIFSHYESYKSFGFGVDVAAMFHDEASNLTATLVARNIGYQIAGFTSNNHEPMPIEVLAGVSYKFHHAPFRLSLTGKDLTNWDLTYNDPALEPTIDQLTGDTIPVPTSSLVQKIAYHTNFGLEIIPNDNFYIRVGFNYQRRNSLGIVDRMSVGGFSFGFGLRIKKFAFNYGIAIYSAAGISNVFGITTNINEWKKKSH